MRKITLPITPSISVLRSSLSTSATFQNLCSSNSLTTAVSCWIMSSISKELFLSLSGLCFFYTWFFSFLIFISFGREAVIFFLHCDETRRGLLIRVTLVRFVSASKVGINSSSSLSEFPLCTSVGFFLAEYGCPV